MVNLVISFLTGRGIVNGELVVTSSMVDVNESISKTRFFALIKMLCLKMRSKNCVLKLTSGLGRKALETPMTHSNELLVSNRDHSNTG